MVKCFKPEGKEMAAEPKLILSAANSANADFSVSKELKRRLRNSSGVEGALRSLVNENEIADISDNDLEYLSQKLKIDTSEIKKIRAAHVLAREARRYNKTIHPMLCTLSANSSCK